MKEITILSGKGGTGKTSITAALASLARDSVFCDNDVDAADLHLVFNPDIKETFSFSSGYKVIIHNEACSDCVKCVEYCRFGAIHRDNEGNLFINPFQCEGCRLCEKVCPDGAITSLEEENNAWFVSETRFGKLVHARMDPGEENSGRLVTEIRNKAREIAARQKSKYVINDGPPGIGCSTIASLSGTGLVLLIVEPSKSALHDVARLIELINAFKVKSFAIINKHDIDESLTGILENYLENKSIRVLAKIPFHSDMIKSISAGKTIIEFNPRSDISRIINNVWKVIGQ
jgi:MinD superfamily P-loop ATPase